MLTWLFSVYDYYYYDDDDDNDYYYYRQGYSYTPRADDVAVHEYVRSVHAGMSVAVEKEMFDTRDKGSVREWGWVSVGSYATTIAGRVVRSRGCRPAVIGKGRVVSPRLRPSATTAVQHP